MGVLLDRDLKNDNARMRRGYAEVRAPSHSIVTRRTLADSMIVS
jgi:hypothetical protein